MALRNRQGGRSEVSRPAYGKGSIRRPPQSEATAILEGDVCPPTASVLPIEMFGDIGTSPLLGNSQASKALDRVRTLR